MVQRIPKFLGGIDADMSEAWAWANNTLGISGNVSSNSLTVSETVSANTLNISGNVSAATITGNEVSANGNLTVNGKTVLYDGMDLGSIA